MGCLPDEMVLEGSLLSALHRLELGRSEIGREVMVVQAHECHSTSTRAKRPRVVTECTLECEFGLS